MEAKEAKKLRRVAPQPLVEAPVIALGKRNPKSVVASQKRPVRVQEESEETESEEEEFNDSASASEDEVSDLAESDASLDHSSPPKKEKKISSIEKSRPSPKQS